jgi:hypothetical protein
VRAGDNSPEVISAARCVNVGLFISGNLRRDVVVSLATGTPEDMVVISFPGAELKRVSPDERSISFFLLKAFKAAITMEMNSVKTLDNGIVVRKTGLNEFIEFYSPKSVYISSSEVESSVLEDIEYADLLLIYSFSEISLPNLSNLERVHHPPHPERFILDINMNSDRKIS